MVNKKGYYFSADAFIAVIIIFLVHLALKPLNQETETQVNIQEDLLDVLSNLKMGEVNDQYFQDLVLNGSASADAKVLEQIVEYYAIDSPEAEKLLDKILSDLNPEENIGIWIGNNLVASYNHTPYERAENILTARQLVSGAKKEDSHESRGFSARAFLKSINNVQYYLFGGYIGDGNISTLIESQGIVNDVELEIAINENFQVYINNNFAGDYNKSLSDTNPAKYSLNEYLPLFISGINTFEIRENESLYIAGGHIKISYENYNYTSGNKKYIHGIKGLINIYDSFYVPSNLTSIEVYLHYTSPVNLFLNMGNETIYQGRGTGVQRTITNAEISSKMEFSKMIEKNIPFRIGIGEVDYLGDSSVLELISVTDMSKYMRCSIFSYGTNKNQCLSNNGIWMLPTNYSEEANKLLVDEVLKFNGNRAGFVGMSADGIPVLFHSLSSDKSSLTNTLDGLSIESNYNANNLRLCSGVLVATEEFVQNSQNDTVKEIIVMLAGQISTPPCNIAVSDLNNDGTINSLDDAIEAACRAHEDYGITVNAIGYGDIVDTNTLSAMAECGSGIFVYQPNVSEIVDTYKDIINDILIKYNLQTVSSSAGIETQLYPDSYIKIEHDKTEIPFGVLINLEKEFDSQGSGNFEIPNETEIVEAKVLSYSGSKWTDRVDVYNSLYGWKNIFKISDFSDAYVELGDPYSISIPNDKLTNGVNKINLTTGISPTNSSEGSIHNKIIYSIVKNGTGYSPISASANGCTWTIEFYDNTNLTTPIPEDYSGDKVCYYTSESEDYNQNDAITNAVHELLKIMDIDLDKRVDSKFSAQDLLIEPSEVSGIPYTISNEVQIRIWR